MQDLFLTCDKVFQPPELFFLRRLKQHSQVLQHFSQAESRTLIGFVGGFHHELDFGWILTQNNSSGSNIICEPAISVRLWYY